MILWLIIISLLNALCAVPMALRVRYDFALNGRVSLPIAVWSGVTVYVHLTATFALAWLDRGSLSEPSLASLAIGIFAATIGSGLIVAARREYASRSRAYGLLEDKLITTGIYRYSRNPQYVGLWLMLLGAAIVSLSQWAFLLAFGIRAHLPSLHNGCRGASPALRIRREVSRILQQDTPVPATQT